MARRRKRRKGILRGCFNVFGSIAFIPIVFFSRLVKDVNKERKY